MAGDRGRPVGGPGQDIDPAVRVGPCRQPAEAAAGRAGGGELAAGPARRHLAGPVAGQRRRISAGLATPGGRGAGAGR